VRYALPPLRGFVRFLRSGLRRFTPPEGGTPTSADGYVLAPASRLRALHAFVFVSFTECGSHGST